MCHIHLLGEFFFIHSLCSTKDRTAIPNARPNEELIQHFVGIYTLQNVLKIREFCTLSENNQAELVYEKLFSSLSLLILLRK